MATTCSASVTRMVRTSTTTHRSIGVPVPQAVVPTDLDLRIEDHRNFAGGYGMLEWHPTSRLRIDGGLRLNVTNEVRDGGEGEEQQAAKRSTVTRTCV